MQIVLHKKPKSPTIIQGFPGFGFVGSVALEFLIDHLKVEQIGRIILEEMPAMVAVHKNQMVDPFGIFYNKEYNLVIVHAVSPTQGLEWKIADFVLELSTKLQAKEIISLEGVAGENPQEFHTFAYSTDKRKLEKMKRAGIEPLKEGIIIGVTGALLVKSKKFPLSCIFCETHSAFPDSKAAAKVIEGLDKYLGLKVDYNPLLKQAEGFEQKLQTLMKKSTQTAELSEQKRMSYVG